MAEDLEDVEPGNTADQAHRDGAVPAGRPVKIRRYPAGRPVVTEIETVPMTAAQRQEAVSVLATLIAQWEQAGSPTSQRNQTD
ncbi:hypothetical protein BL254_23935 [Protofrankia sp. BMG5.30]|nr:hypothetical protein BL254_23935 [Protofrankia sp. BMG5.30]